MFKNYKSYLATEKKVQEMLQKQQSDGLTITEQQELASLMADCFDYQEGIHKDLQAAFND